ncbi:MAG: DUF1670 domain-containing protein [Candidatus Methanoperedens sp.]|nr:DUF1670 domain-containing protein [Candidatus Methanoperedens sp.]MCZ7372493.1 DUF1670 domain-containing protein [Candidatus Methanoperedens sp.]
MKRNQEKERNDRLSFKTLDTQFKQEAMEGLNCSPLEANALVDIVKEVYFPLLEEKRIENIRPGQIVVQAIDLNEPAGKPIKECSFKSVILTIDSGQNDLNIRQEKGIPALRIERIKRVTREAFEQGTLLTAEDLAYKIFSAGYRTIIRDLSILRDNGECIPLRSTQKDIGRTTTHKEQVVKLWLEGHEPAYISRATNHSIEAVTRYLQAFKRVIALTLEGTDKTSIAFLLSISKSLVTIYQELFEKYKNEILPNRMQEIENFLKNNKISRKKGAIL